jgi:hypothetical protein
LKPISIIHRFASENAGLFMGAPLLTSVAMIRGPALSKADELQETRIVSQNSDARAQDQAQAMADVRQPRNK